MNGRYHPMRMIFSDVSIGFMLVFIFTYRRRKLLSQFKHIANMLGILKDTHMEGFWNVIIDIYHVLIEHVVILLPQIPD